MDHDLNLSIDPEVAVGPQNQKVEILKKMYNAKLKAWREKGLLTPGRSIRSSCLS